MYHSDTLIFAVFPFSYVDAVRVHVTQTNLFATVLRYARSQGNINASLFFVIFVGSTAADVG